MEDSVTSMAVEERGEALPPAKKAKLGDGDCSSRDDMTPPLKQMNDDSAAPEGTEHAHSDVAMDTKLPDEKYKYEDQQCGVSLKLCGVLNMHVHVQYRVFYAYSL